MNKTSKPGSRGSGNVGQISSAMKKWLDRYKPKTRQSLRLFHRVDR